MKKPKMSINDFVIDLRSRINPVYSEQTGTESYERRLCAEVIEELMAENLKMRDIISKKEASF